MKIEEDFLKKTCYNICGDYMNIVYGGSFNPPTVAHYEIAKNVLKRFPKSKLIFLPASLYYNKANLINEVDRINMLMLVCERLGERASISTFELENDKFLGTYYSLKQFDDCYFLLGADNFNYIDKWIMFEKLISENKFLIIPRKGYNIEKKISENELLTKYRDNFILLDEFKVNHISSSLYRSTKEEKFVLPEIDKYIKEKELYK